MDIVKIILYNFLVNRKKKEKREKRIRITLILSKLKKKKKKKRNEKMANPGDTFLFRLKNFCCRRK